MFEVYVDKPLASPDKTAPPKQLESRLTNLAISCGGTEATLTQRLSFGSFTELKAQIEALVPSLAEFGRGTGWLLFSLQFCNETGSLVVLLPSTFDPSDFCEPRLPNGQKVYLRATVAPNPSVTGKEKATSGAPSRRALGRREENTLPATATRWRREGGAAGKDKPAPPKTARKAPASPSTATHTATPAAAAKKSVRPPPSATSQRSKTAARATTSKPHQQLHVHSSNSSSISGGRGGFTNTRGRAPAYVFKAGGAGSTGNSSDPSSNRKACSKPPLPSSKQREKPGWNSGNEPAWEEAERKKAAMRKAARARILGKRAAAAAKQARGGAWGGRGGGGRGGKGRVFRRAKRDCRVMDARRKKLSAYLFCDPIGALPPALGKRNLETFRELGRAAVAQMKYVPIANEDSAPKRGRGEATQQGQVLVVFRHENAQQQQPQTIATGSATTGKRSTDDATAAAAAAKATADKRVVVAPSKAKLKPTSFASFATPAKKEKGGGATRAPAALPTALRPPTARPGDIGFFRGGVGFRMRPPSTAAPAAVVPAAAAAPTATPRPRGRDDRGGGAAGGGQGAAALTAAAAAKVRLRAASASSTNSGGGRSSAGVRGSARPRGGGAVAAYKEAKVSRASHEDAAAAAAIMAKLAGGGRGKGKGRAGGGGAAGGEGGDVESLQEQVALLKAAAGLSDEELTWRMETAKPEANAYRIASVALERAETTYERLLWRQGQLEIARARLTGRGVGGDAPTAAFADAVSRLVAASESALRQEGVNCVLSRLGSSSEAVLAAFQDSPTTAPSSTVAPLPADEAAEAVRAAAGALAKLVSAVKATASTGSEVDYAAVKEEVAAEARSLKDRADGLGRDLAALGRRVEAAVGQMEAWQQRKAEAPEFAAEEAAREEAWNEANREANESALREMRALLPEAVWDMNAGDIQAAAAAGISGTVGGGSDASGTAGGVFYPSDLCVRLRECRPLHWLVSAPEDVAGANFLAGDGAAAFTQLEGMDVVEMRAVWSVLPREFCRDADGKKAEWRARFRQQLEGLARQQDRAVVTAGWDPMRGRRATTRMPPLPANRLRHPAYLYPSVEAMESRVARLRVQWRRLDTRKERLSALEAELAEAKSEVDSACADARSGELRKRYGADTLRNAREAAKEAYSALVRDKKSLSASVVEADKMLSSTYPSLEQLESEVRSIAQILGRAATTAASGDSHKTTGHSSAATEDPSSPDSRPAAPSNTDTDTKTSTNSNSNTSAVRVPGAFSEEPELRRRSVAAARKLSPEEERRLRASEVQRAVSFRDAGSSGGSAAAATATTPAAATVVAEGSVDQPGSTTAIETTPTSVQVEVEQERAAAEAGPAATGGATPVAAPTAVVPRTGECLDGAPPPRRPVKVAPGVLALLTKQYSARAMAAQGGGGRRIGATAETKAETTSGEGTERADIFQPVAAPSPAATEGTSVKPTPAAQPAKPISKSLAALIAQKNGNVAPLPGRGSPDGPCSDAVEGAGGGVGIGRKAASPALGFLDELKAKAATSTRSGCPALSSSSSSLPPLPLRLPLPPASGAPVPGAGSFLDELKARAARIS